jgi:phage major head subunit gpT-like protein
MTTETKRYDWLANYPMLEPWVGARRFSFLREYNQTVVMGPAWVQTIPFTRRQMQIGDQLGVIARGIKNFLSVQTGAFDATAFAKYFSAAGAGPTGYDGQAIFSANHPHGPSGAVQSNLSAGVAFSPAALDAVMTTMRGLRLENGEPAGVNPDTLIVGPALEQRMKAAIGADLRVVAVDNTGKEAAAAVVAAAATTNVFKGVVTGVVDNRRPASGTGAFWWEVRDSKLPPPLMRHLFRAPEPHHQDEMGSFCRFMYDQFWFGVEGDWVVDAGFPFGTHRATGTT